MDPNGFTAPFQLTKTLHRDLYPTIDPSSPDLKAINKTVLINGASGGLGGVCTLPIAWLLVAQVS